jgi:hypothetical protein
MRAELHREYARPEEALALARSLTPDDAGYVRSTARGSTLHLSVEARSVGELRRTLEDALACLSAAERTWERQASADPEEEEE